MITPKQLKTGLDLAAVNRKPVKYQGLFTAAPQVPEGKSTWAKWVKAGHLQQEDVIWAFIEGEPKIWLAIRVKLNNKVWYFNLQNEDDRKKLKDLENKYQNLISL